MTEPIDWLEEEDRIAPQYLAAGDPTGWFDELYAAGERGRITMPFDRREPHPLLVEWAEGRDLDGTGRRAVVVGCGLGADAEYVAARGFETTAFDVSEAAVRIARQRHPGSPVDYRTADLLDLPPAWLRRFDLVVEIITVQALPDPPRRQAIANVSSLVADRGTLFVVAAVHGETEVAEPPPWPLRRDEIEAFATDGVVAVSVELAPLPGDEAVRRWRAELARP
jgi:SAM-dependent methyltransferase